MSRKSVMGALALVTMAAPVVQAEAPLGLAGVTATVTAFADGNGIADETAVHLDLFFQSEYGYCDARKVAHVWNTDPFSAKAIIGSKIAHGITDLVDIDIASTAGSVSCDWSDLGLTYDHAVALAGFWGGSTLDAKATAGQMASNVGHKRFVEQMRDVLARADVPQPQGPDGEVYQRAFFASEYGYCDALKVADVWGTNVGAAKSVIGQKIVDGLTDLVDADIQSTGSRVSCSWAETDLSFEDALALADFWGVPVGEAKQKATGYTSEWGTREFRRRLGSVLGRG